MTFTTIDRIWNDGTTDQWGPVSITVSLSHQLFFDLHDLFWVLNFNELIVCRLLVICLALLKEYYRILMLVADVAITLQREFPAVGTMLVKEAISQQFLVEDKLWVVEVASDYEGVSSRVTISMT